VFDRMQHLFNALSTQWASDPAARGAAKMTAGVILMVEGLFGPLRGGGTKGSGGLVGGIVGVVVGVIFIGLGQWMTPHFEDGILVEGQIVDVREGVSEGRASYSAVYAYSVGGEEFRFTSSSSSSSRPILGDPAQIVYSAREPRNAYRADGVDGHMPKIFMGLGGLVAVLASFSLIVSIVLLSIGIWLFRSGRRDRQSAGESGGFWADFISLAGRARRGDIRVHETAVGIQGPSQGSPSALPL
jgi:hypothetical protein